MTRCTVVQVAAWREWGEGEDCSSPEAHQPRDIGTINNWWYHTGKISNSVASLITCLIIRVGVHTRAALSCRWGSAPMFHDPQKGLDSALHYTTLPLVSPTLSLWLKYCQMTIPADAIQPLLLPCNCYSAPIQICHCLSAPCQWGPWQWLMSQDQQYTLKTLQNIKSLNVTFWYIILHICWIMILEDTPQLFNS